MTMGPPKFTGMTSDVESKKRRQQLREITYKGGFKHSELPYAVAEDSEYDSEPGGARLDSRHFGACLKENQGKVSSDLNPTSSPWVPKINLSHINITDTKTKAKSTQAVLPEVSAKMTDTIASQVSSPVSSTTPNQASSSTKSDIMSGLQFVPGHWAVKSSNSVASVPIIGGQLNGSASMGNLPYYSPLQQTPVRQSNSHSVQGSHGTTFRAGVPSPESDSPKASAYGMTEPRNFAPRTANVAQMGAPPKFNLNVSDGVSTGDSNDPFVTPAAQVSMVQSSLFGSQTDATRLRMTGSVPFGNATDETLDFDSLLREQQSSIPANQGGEIQPFMSDEVQNLQSQVIPSNTFQQVTNNSTGAQNIQGQNIQGQNIQGQNIQGQNIQGQSIHGEPYQQVTNNSTGAQNIHGDPYQQGAIQPYNGQAGQIVPYQVGYPPQLTVASYGNQVSDHIRAQRSRELNQLTASPSGLPSASLAMHQANFPFVEPATRSPNLVVRGVVKIGNIPFVTNRAEIIAVLGRNSRILNDTEEPVHIIMERVTGKTTDAYVEFQSLEDATKAVEKHQQNVNRGRVTRIGQRPVEIELSSQSALMKDLFPSARGVFWDGFNPQMLPHNANEPWENFKGFVSNEEMTMLVKHVEVPHRSPFSKECPQRPFECLISTLTKFPWHMKTHITVQQRHAMHKATCDLIRILVNSIRDRRDELNLTPRLLKRVVAAAMRCEGLSAAQKDDIAFLVDMGEMEQRSFGQPRFADNWRHLYVLVPKTGVPLDVIEWYIAVIREETNRFLETQPFQEKCQTRALGDATDGYFGYFWRELNLPVGPAFDNLTLSQLAIHEYQTMESIIRRALAMPNALMQ